MRNLDLGIGSVIFGLHMTTQAVRNRFRQVHRSRCAGFSLVEIAIVVSIIGILAALAIPAFKKSKDSAKIAALENDLRIYEQDFET